MPITATREEYVKQIKEKYEKILLTREGVRSVSVGETERGLGIVVGVESKQAIVPIELEGVPVKCEIVGTIKAQS